LEMTVSMGYFVTLVCCPSLLCRRALRPCRVVGEVEALVVPLPWAYIRPLLSST
jgi:hypothetical protein